MTVLTPRVLAVVAGIPLLTALATVILVSAWAPDLPAHVVTHWGVDGADGFSPVWAAALFPIVTTAVVALGTVAFLAATSRGGFTIAHRLVGALDVGLAVLFPTLVVGPMAVQLGGPDPALDPSGAPSVLPWLLAGLAGAVVVGVIGWFLLPRPTVPVAEAESVAPLRVAAGERVAWFGVASVRRPGAIGVGVVVLLVFVAAGVAVATSGDLAVLPLLLLPIVLVLLSLTLLRWTVRVDATGITATAGFGLPRIRIPLDDLAEVAVVESDPLRDFGGWGLRLSLNLRQWGIVLRRGPALRLRRRRGRTWVITVDGAEQAAAAAQALRATPRG